MTTSKLGACPLGTPLDQWTREGTRNGFCMHRCSCGCGNGPLGHNHAAPWCPTEVEPGPGLSAVLWLHALTTLE